MQKLILTLTILCFFITSVIGTCPVYAQDFVLPAPGVRVGLSPEYNPPILKGLKVHPDNPFRFDFILDQGDKYSRHSEGVRSTTEESKGALRSFGLRPQDDKELKSEATRLIKYFLASLTIPEKDLWVNLSPYEKNRIVPESFGQTQMGRDLLAEDYMLKQITASLIYPEDEIGKKFWKRIYEEAAKKFGTTDIPVNTFNKVWIVPEKAVVYENAKAGTAYVVDSKLKVMLEQDYLSLKEHEDISGDSSSLKHKTNQIGSQVVREVVLPELEKEVNEDKNFAQLRQVYNSFILAAWYKKKITDSILDQVYADKKKIAGIEIDDPQAKEKIYQRYLEAFKKGVFDYIQEEQDPITMQPIPRKYFSGGVQLQFGQAFDSAMIIVDKPPAGIEDQGIIVQTKLIDVGRGIRRSPSPTKLIDISRVNARFIEESAINYPRGEDNQVIEMIGPEGERYFVKTYHENHSVINEYVSYKIAQKLGVHVPQVALIRDPKTIELLRKKVLSRFGPEEMVSRRFSRGNLFLVEQPAQLYQSPPTQRYSGLEELIAFCYLMKHNDIFLPNYNVLKKDGQYIAFDLLTNFNLYGQRDIFVRFSKAIDEIDTDKLVDLIHEFEHLDLAVIFKDEFENFDDSIRADELSALQRAQKGMRVHLITDLGKILMDGDSPKRVSDLLAKLQNGQWDFRAAANNAQLVSGDIPFVRKNIDAAMKGEDEVKEGLTRRRILQLAVAMAATRSFSPQTLALSSSSMDYLFQDPMRFRAYLEAFYQNAVLWRSPISGKGMRPYFYFSDILEVMDWVINNFGSGFPISRGQQRILLHTLTVDREKTFEKLYENPAVKQFAEWAPSHPGRNDTVIWSLLPNEEKERRRRYGMEYYFYSELVDLVRHTYAITNDYPILINRVRNDPALSRFTGVYDKFLQGRWNEVKADPLWQDYMRRFGTPMREAKTHLEKERIEKERYEQKKAWAKEYQREHIQVPVRVILTPLNLFLSRATTGITKHTLKLIVWKPNTGPEKALLLSKEDSRVKREFLPMQYVRELVDMIPHGQQLMPGQFKSIVFNRQISPDEADNYLRRHLSGTDKAMNGGIDLTSDKTLSVQNNGQAIKFHIDPAQLARLQNAPGFVPVIINIQPMTNIRQWLGLNDQVPSDQKMVNIE